MTPSPFGSASFPLGIPSPSISVSFVSFVPSPSVSVPLSLVPFPSTSTSDPLAIPSLSQSAAVQVVLAVLGVNPWHQSKGFVSCAFGVPSLSISGSFAFPMPSPSVSTSINKVMVSESVPAALVAVIVKVVCTKVAVGVPEINPVAVSKVIPAGRFGRME